MKSLLTTIIIFTSCITLLSQVYAPGKIELKDGSIITGEIKLDNWNSATINKLKYRKSNSKSESVKLEEVKFIEVNDQKYEQFTLLIERSFGKNYEYEEDIQYAKEETLFLKYIIQGEYSLLYEQADKYELFFYRKSDGPVVQLLNQYGLFRITNSVNYEKKVHRNIKKFRNQLFDSLRIEGMEMIDYNQMEYTSNDLIPYFKKLNNNEFTSYKSSNTGQLSLSIRLGSQLNRYKTSYQNFNNADVSLSEFRIGLEGSLLLPAIRQNTSVFAEVEYRSSEFNDMLEPVDQTSPFGPQEFNILYRALQLNLGLRYIFLNFKGGNVYGMVQANIIQPLENEIYFGQFETENKNKVRLGHNISVGAYFLKNFSAELIYGWPRNLTNMDSRATIDLTFYGLKLGYTFLKTDR